MNVEADEAPGRSSQLYGQIRLDAPMKVINFIYSQLVVRVPRVIQREGNNVSSCGVTS
jgi:hypothetical protein